MNIIKKARELIHELRKIRHDTIENRILLGTMLAKNSTTATSLKQAEFKVFSQFGDDGIIQFLINKLPIQLSSFVEFGVENYEESNTRFLLIHNNWRGLVIDGAPAHIDYIKKDSLYWRHDLTAVASFITAENINKILIDNGFSGKLGLLSVDIDGNDYWVWKAISVADAEIVIAEYNSLFGVERAITVPYQADFYWLNAHYSGLYFGTSLLSLCDLAESKGYAFVGCNQAGNNAYFVKKGLLNSSTGIKSLSAEEGFVESRFRQSRNQQGKLTFADKQASLKEIAGLPVVNTRTGILETF